MNRDAHLGGKPPGWLGSRWTREDEAGRDGTGRDAGAAR